MLNKYNFNFFNIFFYSSTSGVNFLVRKMAAMAKPASEIKVVGDQIQITMNAGFTSHTDVYNLNEECDREHQGAKQKVCTM